MLRIVTYVVIGLLLLPMAVVLGTSFTAASFVSFPPRASPCAGTRSRWPSRSSSIHSSTAWASRRSPG